MINNIKFNVWIKLAKISVDRFFLDLYCYSLGVG